MKEIYKYSIPKADGTDLKLKDFEGKVLLIVNTATQCGFTPQYKDLKEMYDKFHEKGLEIIDIPCNQFKEQAPESDEEIHTFCSVKYKVEFQQMKKSDVNGKNQLSLYKYLKEQKGFEGFGKGPKALTMSALLKSIDKSYKDNSDIKWNFTKFLVDREGNVVERFEPTEKMEKIKQKIEVLL